jgi:hypothetical protein
MRCCRAEHADAIDIRIHDRPGTGWAAGRRGYLPGRVHVASATTNKGAIRRVLPLRPRLHTMAICRLAVNLIRRRPVTARQTCRLQTHRPRLEYLVTDRSCSRKELGRCCAMLLPGCRREIQCESRRIGLAWDNARE